MTKMNKIKSTILVMATIIITIIFVLKLAMPSNCITCDKYQELLLNGGLEKGRAIPDDWKFYQNGAYNYASLTFPVVPGRNGGKCAKISYTSSDISKSRNTPEAYLTQTVNNINTSQNYEFSGWMNISEVNSSGVNLEIDWINKTKFISTSYAVQGEIGTTGGWRYYYTLLPKTNIPANATKGNIYLIMYGDGTGSVCFDDISFRSYFKNSKDSSNRYGTQVQGYFSTYDDPLEYLNFNYSLLDTIIYHHISINTDGSLRKSYGTYDPANLISYAHYRNVSVVLGFTRNSSSDTDLLLSNSTLQNIAINNLLNEVHNYGYDGIDNDLENTNTTNYITGEQNSKLLTIFQKNLYNTFKNSSPDNGSILSSYRVSIAVDSKFNTIPDGRIWDIPAVENYTDFIGAMGYNWMIGVNSTSNSPYLTNKSGDNGILTSILMFEKLITPTNDNPKYKKLLLGIPWYGYKIHTQDNSRLSPMINNEKYEIKYKDYYDIVNSSAGIGNWDDLWQTPWYVYKAGILENPDFEYGIYGWTPDQTGTNATFSYTNTGADGNKSVSITYPNSDSGQYAYYMQNVPIKSNIDYRLSAWMKTNNITGNDSKARIEIDWLNDNGYISDTAVADSITGTTGWTKYDKLISGTDIPEDATNANIYLLLKVGPGTVWFDNVSFDSNPTSGTYWRQIQYDNVTSYNKKFDMIRNYGLGGISIWELGQGTNHTELWNTIWTGIKQPRGIS
jgi:spore germination protein YaaH